MLQLPKLEDAELTKSIFEISAEITIKRVKLFTQNADAQDPKRAALLEFADHSTALKWMKAVASVKKEVHLLDCEIIAKMLLANHLQASATFLGFDTTTSEMMKKFLQTHEPELVTMLFQKGEFKQLLQIMGIEPDQATDSQPEVKPMDKVLQLKTKLQSSEVTTSSNA